MIIYFQCSKDGYFPLLIFILYSAELKNPHLLSCFLLLGMKSIIYFSSSIYFMTYWYSKIPRYTDTLGSCSCDLYFKNNVSTIFSWAPFLGGFATTVLTNYPFLKHNFSYLNYNKWKQIMADKWLPWCEAGQVFILDSHEV